MKSQIAPPKQSSTHSDDDQTTPPQPAEAHEEPAEPLSLDLVFEVLKNERRRHVLQYLDSNSGTVSLSDLAEHIAAIENDTTVQALTSQERKRVYVGLYQCHLPKMDDTDVVNFDGNRGTIELGENAQQLYSFLETESESTRPWPAYYLTLTGVSLTVFVAALLAAPAVLTPVFGVSLLGFALLGTAQLTTE